MDVVFGVLAFLLALWLLHVFWRFMRTIKWRKWNNYQHQVECRTRQLAPEWHELRRQKEPKRDK